MITASAIVKHVRWAAVGTWGSKIVSLAIFVLLTRLLPVEAIGAIAMIAAYLAMLQLFGEAGLADYLVQANERDAAQEQTVFWTQLALGCCVAALLWLAAPLAAASMADSVPAEALVKAMALNLPLVAAARVPDALMRKQLEFKKLAFRNLAAALCGGIVGVICALRGYGVWSLVIKQLVESVVALVAVMLGARWRPRLRYSRATLGAPLRYGLGFLGARSLNVLHGRLDVLVIGWLLGPLALGYYSVAMRVYQVVTEMFTSVIDSVAVPVLARAKHETDELGRNFLRLVKGSSLLSMTAYAGLVALGPLVVEVAFGPNWSSAGPILRWLGVAGFIVGPLWFNGGVMLATGRAFAWMLVIGAYCVVGAVLFPLAALYAGATGVAIAIVVRGLLLAPLSAGCALRVAQVSVGRYIAAWTPNAAVAIAVALGAWLGASGASFADLPLYLDLVAGAALGLICFLIVVPRLANGMWVKLLELGGLQRPSSLP